VKKILFIIGIVLLCGKMVAQDLHFSQFYASPLTLNPANTGWYNGDWRISGNYRQQWKAIDNRPFSTYALGVERQFAHYLNFFSVGVQLLSDESGYVGLRAHKALLSGSYARNINGHSLSLGFQAGVVYKSTNIDRYTYDEQFDLGGESVFNPNFPISELAQEPILYPLFHAGLLWSKTFAGKFAPEVGIAFFNINSPKETFYGTSSRDTRLPLRTSLSLGGDFTISDNIIIQPTLLYMIEHQAKEFLFGSNLVYTAFEHIKPFAGTFIRYGSYTNFDASAWVIGARYGRWRFGVSYDVNISTLRTATHGRGAIEFSLVYISPSTRNSLIKIPCDRL
jgi:type IX secretion system PorP/SprF family membrane protein